MNDQRSRGVSESDTSWSRSRLCAAILAAVAISAASRGCGEAHRINQPEAVQLQPDVSGLDVAAGEAARLGPESDGADGASPCLTLSPPEKLFLGADVPGGKAKIAEVTLSNCGDAPVVITGAALSSEATVAGFILDWTASSLPAPPTIVNPWTVVHGQPLRVVVKFEATLAAALMWPTPMTAQLTISGPSIGSHSLTVAGIGAIVTCPVAQITVEPPVDQVTLGTTVKFSGATSLGYDGRPAAAYEWTLKQPVGGTAQLSMQAGIPQVVSLEPSQLGLYEVLLHVWDSTGARSCSADSKYVNVVAE
ncbi:MAG: hypothetical protein FJ100_17085 [Deltaproteobacteria bacterium]|nr:hypothetical protein [Deltaproteobacteria bacterium]